MMVPGKQCLQTNINVQRLWQHIHCLHRLIPGGSLSTKRRKWSRAPIPNQETLFKKDTLTKGKLVFSTGISLGRLTILKNGLMLSNTWQTQTQ